MKYLFLIFITFNLYGQKCDTIINKTDYNKLLYLVNGCDEEISNYQSKIKSLEIINKNNQQRIKFLEEMLINREKFIIKKCPTFKKRKRRI